MVFGYGIFLSCIRIQSTGIKHTRKDEVDSSFEVLIIMKIIID